MIICREVLRVAKRRRWKRANENENERMREWDEHVLKFM
jgi:hypothetical protein